MEDINKKFIERAIKEWTGLEEKNIETKLQELI